jgi:cis-3-alkyl-4-acyloxetan-2-one decarboxylase
MTLKETMLHQWLAIPYQLHVTLQQPTAPAKAPALLFLHGIGNSGEVWSDVIDQLPSHYRIITIDLLGFGKSPRPLWNTYDAKHQARGVLATYLRLRIRGRVIIVGHSLGSLVAVEMAKRYPLLIKSLILCSPPFYKIDENKRRLVPSSDKMLQDMYRLARKHPDQFVKISTLAVKLGLVNKSYNLTRDNASAYMNALEATIINQTSLRDAIKLKIPTHIIFGRLDPVVVARNLRILTKINEHVTLSTVLATHEIKGPFIEAVVKTIIKTAGQKKKGAP